MQKVEAQKAVVRIKEAERETSIATQRTAELQAVVMPLDLNANQQALLGVQWRRFSGRKVIVQSSGFDPEGRILASLIVASMRAASISVEGPVFGLTWGMGPGNTIFSSDREFAGALADGLTKTGKLRVSTSVPDEKTEPLRSTFVAVGSYPFRQISN